MDTKSISFLDAFRLAAAFTAVGVGLFFLYSISDILLVFLAAFIFAIALDKPLDGLVKRGVPRNIAAVVIYVVFLILTVLTVTLTVPPLIQEVRNFTTDIPALVEEAEQTTPTASLEGSATASIQSLVVSYSEVFQSSSQVVIDTALRVYSGLLTFMIIFFLALFLNIQRDGVRQFITLLVPKDHQTYANGLFLMVQNRVSSWLWGKTVSSLFVAVIVFGGLWLLQIPYAVTFTLLAFFLNYIPFVGPFLAGIIPTAIGFFIAPLIGMAVASLYFVANTLEGFVVIPLLLKQSIQLNPLLLIFAVLVGGRVGGALGILLSIPVAAILTLLYEEYHRKWYHRGGNNSKVEDAKQHLTE